MMHRIYAASYAIYYWSDWLFLAAFAALFVIPFTSLDARFAAWCIVLLIAFVSLAARGAAEALCRALLRRQRRARRQFTEEEARRIELLEQQGRASHIVHEATHLAAERQRQSVEAWWTDRHRS